MFPKRNRSHVQENANVSIGSVDEDCILLGSGQEISFFVDPFFRNFGESS